MREAEGEGWQPVCTNIGLHAAHTRWAGKPHGETLVFTGRGVGRETARSVGSEAKRKNTVRMSYPQPPLAKDEGAPGAACLRRPSSIAAQTLKTSCCLDGKKKKQKKKKKKKKKKTRRFTGRGINDGFGQARREWYPLSRWPGSFTYHRPTRYFRRGANKQTRGAKKRARTLRKTGVRGFGAKYGAATRRSKNLFEGELVLAENDVRNRWPNDQALNLMKP